MAEKKINEDPRVTDVVVFELEAPGADGCFSANPYKIDKVSIYYVERDFLGTNYGTYETVKSEPALIKKLQKANEKVCEEDTELNRLQAARIQNELESKSLRTSYFYKDAVLVYSFGSSYEPVWLNPTYFPDKDVSKEVVVQIDPEQPLEDPTTRYTDPKIGHFEFKWSPPGKVREGDYFICWTWTPLLAGDSLSAHINFSLFGDPRAVASIPTHITPTDKYETLLERYLPEMYKYLLTNNDLTPVTTEKLNGAVAKGFTFVEDMANQLIDLFDANVVHESLLVYLSNFFNLKLKSNDPTLWRRQIKEAIRLFKRKGTQGGLEAAFSQAGMTLRKLTRLWQVVSKYTWQESFRVKDSASFNLAKTIVSPSAETVQIWVRRSDSEEYVEYDINHVTFDEQECEFGSIMTWIGDELSSNPVALFEGDVIRILYRYAEFPSEEEETLNDYILNLSLADQRDELDQDFPLKNWNVRLIEEDDPLFDVVVPVKHPFHDPLVFGKIRTEFPFSENIYNMEEYNGSTRDSFDVCHIDKDFLDPCGGGSSSKFNLDVAVEVLSDDRIAEVRDIIKEYTPFHSVVHTLSFEGEINEYIQSPVEEVELLIKFSVLDYILSGSGNSFFNRSMIEQQTMWVVKRDELATMSTIVPEDSDPEPTGTAYNAAVAIITPNVVLDSIGIRGNSHTLEIKSPSLNSGFYTISNFNGNMADVVTGANELPNLDQDVFTFTLSNIEYRTSAATIIQDDLFKLSDPEDDFSLLGVKTQWDVDHTDYEGGPWKVEIQTFSPTPFEIAQLLPDGSIILLDPDRLISTGDLDVSDLDYKIIDDEDEIRAESETGRLLITRRANVDLNDIGIVDIQQYAQNGDYLYYGTNDEEYLVTETTEDGNLYIEGYGDGDAVGVGVEIRHRLVGEDVGYFAYRGIKLLTSTDYEAELGILNGKNPPITDPDEIPDNSHFKECYMIQIDDEYYRVVDIDGTEITMTGNPVDWGTLGAGGTLVNFSIIHFEKDTVEAKFTVFDQLDRKSKDVVIREIEDSITNDIAIIALEAHRGSDIRDITTQEEGVGFKIEYRDGSTTTGDL